MGPGTDPQQQPQPPTLDEVLAAAARPEPVAAQAAENALAAFREARDEGALGLPTRPDDDWRPAEPGTRIPWIKAGLGTFVAGIMLGGVAVATGTLPAPFGDPSDGRPSPASSASTSPSGIPAATASAVAPRVTRSAGRPAATPGAVRHPSTAEDRAAHCRAYEAAEANGRAGNGKALDSAVRERLEAAAGGPDGVEAYCAGLSQDGRSDASEHRATSDPGRNTAAAVAPTTGVARGGQDKGRVPKQKPARQ
ncbi:hypothetical protein [Streptomyces peucetius]|uniref:Extensin n=1 Tax=Streptomyces peucetius TaxID=1950 RepID=A0ABY6IHF1_STRPE|nr:hypothetical protein [Streptomyces peucetius]UYQ65267.1 hypothetical protein OGH68_29920 [Streptomyces peucetius]